MWFANEGMPFAFFKLKKKRDDMNANPAPASQGSIYVMGRTTEEYERLRRRSEVLGSASVLDRAGLLTTSNPAQIRR